MWGGVGETEEGPNNWTRVRAGGSCGYNTRDGCHLPAEKGFMEGTVLSWSLRCLVSPGLCPFHRVEEAGTEPGAQVTQLRRAGLESSIGPASCEGSVSGWRGVHPLAALCFCLSSATNSLWDSGQVTAPLIAFGGIWKEGAGTKAQALAPRVPGTRRLPHDWPPRGDDQVVGEVGSQQLRSTETCVQAGALPWPWPQAKSSLALSLRFFANKTGRYLTRLPGRVHGNSTLLKCLVQRGVAGSFGWCHLSSSWVRRPDTAGGQRSTAHSRCSIKVSRRGTGKKWVQERAWLGVAGGAPVSGGCGLAWGRGRKLRLGFGPPHCSCPTLRALGEAQDPPQEGSVSAGTCPGAGDSR